MNTDQAVTNRISVAVTDLEIHLKDLNADAARLQSLDPVDATPSYHKNSHGVARYLYLIHPQKDGQRVREYIGSKQEKIFPALDRVQAYEDLVQVKLQAADIQAQIDLVARYLAAALRVAEGGWGGMSVAV